MHNTPALLHIEPLGKPAADVGMFFMERLFTKVVHTLSAVMQEPTIIASSKADVLLFLPPSMDENVAHALLQSPSATIV